MFETTAAHLIRAAVAGYKNPAAVSTDIEQSLVAGKLQAKAATRTLLISPTNRPSVADYKIPADLWKRVDAEGQFGSVWDTGCVVVPAAGKACAVQLTGIQIDQAGLAIALNGHVDTTPRLKKASNAGRPTYDHGYPIASIVIDCLLEGPDAWVGEKAYLLVEHVNAAYRRAGMPALNQRNAAGIAAGIKRALQERRSDLAASDPN